MKIGSLLARPPTVTITGPEVAPVGTGAVMVVSLQLVGTAGTVLNFTVLVPCDEPKLEPVIVIGVPTAPAVGDRLLMTGAGTIVSWES